MNKRLSSILTNLIRRGSHCAPIKKNLPLPVFGLPMATTIGPK